MTYKITLRRESDGASIVFEDTFENGDESVVWYWTEGNGGCDCNRSLKFGDAEIDTAECSDGRYTLTSIEAPDGRVLDL